VAGGGRRADHRALRGEVLQGHEGVRSARVPEDLLGAARSEQRHAQAGERLQDGLLQEEGRGRPEVPRPGPHRLGDGLRPHLHPAGRARVQAIGHEGRGRSGRALAGDMDVQGQAGPADPDQVGAAGGGLRRAVHVRRGPRPARPAGAPGRGKDRAARPRVSVRQGRQADQAGRPAAEAEPGAAAAEGAAPGFRGGGRRAVPEDLGRRHRARGRRPRQGRGPDAGRRRGQEGRQADDRFASD
jgi:hypothetical protein